MVDGNDEDMSDGSDDDNDDDASMEEADESEDDSDMECVDEAMHETHDHPLRSEAKDDDVEL
jgi:hypothetical protein